MNFIHRYLVLIIAAVFLIVLSNVRWSQGNWRHLIMSDGKAYYTYLPAIFIYSDLQYKFMEEVEAEYNPNDPYLSFRHWHNDRVVNKYYAGTPVAILPFFLASQTYAWLTDDPADGYSKPYVVGVTLAGVCYLCLGLWFLQKLLISFGASKWMNLVIIPSIAFGTNAFYYAICESAMSHLYSFGFISMFLWFARSYFTTHSARHLYICAACLGMIILIRPVNVIVLLSLPFFAGSMGEMKSGFTALLANRMAVVISAIIVFAIVSIQLILYKLQTGSFFVYSYANEGFNWGDPHMIDILFSYKKGLFLYTPLWFIALPGLVWIIKKNRFQGISLLVFFVALVYMLSCWWNWWYGGSFSGRVFIEFLPFLAIMLLFTFQLIRNTALRGVYIALMFLCLTLNQFQTYQYRYGLIHWEDTTKEKYWDVFLKLP